MANRSDFNSAFPRAMKRMWMLGKYQNAEHAADVKKLMISAHAAEKAARNKVGRRDLDTSTDESAGE